MYMHLISISISISKPSVPEHANIIATFLSSSASPCSRLENKENGKTESKNAS